MLLLLCKLSWFGCCRCSGGTGGCGCGGVGGAVALLPLTLDPIINSPRTQWQRRRRRSVSTRCPPANRPETKDIAFVVFERSENFSRRVIYNYARNWRGEETSSSLCQIEQFQLNSDRISVGLLPREFEWKFFLSIITKPRAGFHFSERDFNWYRRVQ